MRLFNLKFWSFSPVGLIWAALGGLRDHAKGLLPVDLVEIHAAPLFHLQVCCLRFAATLVVIVSTHSATVRAEARSLAL
jgi:hypothetical protein